MLIQAVESYIAVRRATGFAFRSEGSLLKSFAAFSEAAGKHYVCSETARGVQIAQLDTGVPMAFCVLTCDTLEQAIDRAGLKSGNKGYDAGMGAVEMAQLSRKLSGKPNAKSRRGKR